MDKNSKPVIEVKPVTWVNGGTPHKYQASATLVRPNGDKKVLVGDPMSSENAAMESLVHEVIQRDMDISRIKEVLKEANLI